MNRRLLDIPGGEDAVFLERPNRFLLKASGAFGEAVGVHVPDPGRLLELLYPGNRILVIPASSPGRKTAWSLLGAWTGTGWRLVNTSFHRRLAHRIFASDISPFGAARSVRAEVNSPLGRSRFDFLIDDGLWVEVKGCTLERDGVAMFPDAPTSRGRKHVAELAEMASAGIRTAVVFLVFVDDVTRFAPNRETDPEFAHELERAIFSGVDVKCLQLSFDGCSVYYTGTLEFTLNP